MVANFTLLTLTLYTDANLNCALKTNQTNKPFYDYLSIYLSIYLEYFNYVFIYKSI